MEYVMSFVLGGLLYGGLELLWRGWTHWTMLLCGGSCFAMMSLVERSTLSLWKKMLLSAVLITTAEYLTGCVVNLALGWQVWDYSGCRGNLLGQICPAFSLLWLALSLPGLWLCRWGRRACQYFSSDSAL